METKLWLKHRWNDFNLRWNPKEYNGIINIRLPSDSIWRPGRVYNIFPYAALRHKPIISTLEEIK